MIRQPLKFGLIIQGPIVSGGMSGATYGKGRTHAPSSSFVKFDSSEYISANIDSASNFDCVVVSTWDYEDTSRITIREINRNKTYTILNADPTPNAKKLRSAIDGIPHAHELNKFRQFHSTLQGLLKLKELGCTHALKIRTDQAVAVDLLYEELKDFAISGKRGLVVPGLRRDNPLIVSDFYLGGAVSDFEVVARLMSNPEFQFHENVHIDLFYKNIWAHPTFSLQVPFLNLFLENGRNSKNVGAYFAPIAKELLHPATQEIYASIKWRGEYLGTVQPDMFFRNSSNQDCSSSSSASLLGELNYRSAFKSFSGGKSLLKFLANFAYNVSLIGLREFRRNLSTFRDVHGIRFR